MVAQPRLCGCFLLLLAAASGTTRGDGPQDNVADKVRPVPPPGIEIPADARSELETSLNRLAEKIAALRAASTDTANNARQRSSRAANAPLWADVAIFRDAVQSALEFQEFFQPGELDSARKLLQMGHERADQLAQGNAPWAAAAGLVVRGYVSRIDGSVQPYGLLIPESYSARGGNRVRLDLWCHGRGETLSEVNFLTQRTTQRGPIAPENAIVLHLYGRYCNANKLAGEIDGLEALEAVQSHYRIDENRVVMRGFSMGGAACWQFAVHYADRWAAAAPGAGFSETPLFLKVFQQEELQPRPWERTLWHLYDCPDWVENLENLPVVAYSGELDIQKQAADVMAEAYQRNGMQLVHLIGPQTKHAYHPETAAEIERRLTLLAARGRNAVPRSVTLTTWTLRYPKMHWLRIEGLAEHWSKALVRAQLRPEAGRIAVETQNVTDLVIELPTGGWQGSLRGPVVVQIDGASIPTAPASSDRSLRIALHRADGTWASGDRPDRSRDLVKRPGLQGPIDDAFLDSFLIVLPSSSCAHPAVDQWVLAESQRAIREWRKQFRGRARVKRDADVTDDDVAQHHLVLWGDPTANSVLARIADKLPIAWNAETVRVGNDRFPADKTVPVLIYPNPRNSARYVVLNSGFTFREYDYLNNARQVPKLPDWAVIDISTAPSSRWPGAVLAADFFDERWRLKTP